MRLLREAAFRRLKLGSNPARLWQKRAGCQGEPIRVACSCSLHWGTAAGSGQSRRSRCLSGGRKTSGRTGCTSIDRPAMPRHGSGRLCATQRACRRSQSSSGVPSADSLPVASRSDNWGAASGFSRLNPYRSTAYVTAVELRERPFATKPWRDRRFRCSNCPPHA